MIYSDEILITVAEHPGGTAQTIGKHLGWTYDAARGRVSNARRAGLIHQLGGWRLTHKGRHELGALTLGADAAATAAILRADRLKHALRADALHLLDRPN